VAANGLMYTASFNATSGFAGGTVQDLWQITASATASILIHSWRVTMLPVITSGVAQDLRFNLQILTRSGTAGTGGTAVTPVPVNKRNTVTATSVWTRNVTAVATAGSIISNDYVSVVVPYERVYTPDQRIVLPAAASGSFLSLYMPTPPGATVVGWSTEVYFEEI